MGGGLNFSPEEEKEFKEITSLNPTGFTEKLSVFFDRLMNSIWMFFILIAYSLLGAVFSHYLTPLLFWSNAYQLSSLPVVAIAASLGTRLLMRLVFRIYLNQKKRDADREKEMEIIQSLVLAQADELREMKQIHQEIHRQLKEHIDELGVDPNIRLERRIEEYLVAAKRVKKDRGY